MNLYHSRKLLNSIEVYNHLEGKGRDYLPDTPGLQQPHLLEVHGGIWLPRPGEINLIVEHFANTSIKTLLRNHWHLIEEDLWQKK